MAKIESLPSGSKILACVITLGEAEAGHQMTKTTDQPRRDEFRAFLNSEFKPNALDLTVTSSHYYALIIGRIFQNQQPNSKRTKTEKHLIDMGVQINDVWIAAVAWEHNYTLVTTDKMRVILQWVPEIKTDNWVSGASEPEPPSSRSASSSEKKGS